MIILTPSNSFPLGAPQGMEDQCRSLPVIDNGRGLSSFWQPEAHELASLNAGGSIELSVAAYDTHPMVSVSVNDFPGVMQVGADVLTKPVTDEVIEEACMAMAITLAAQDGVRLNNAGYRRGAELDPVEHKRMQEYVRAAVEAALTMLAKSA